MHSQIYEILWLGYINNIYPFPIQKILWILNCTLVNYATRD